MADLSTEEQARLMRAFEPVLFLHQREAFLPVDAAAMLTVADLWQAGGTAGTPLQSLDELPINKPSESFYLKLRQLDNLGFQVSPEERVDGRIGPAGVAALARRLYGRSLAGSGVLSRPKYYARVTTLRLAPRANNARDKVIQARFTDVFGRTWIRLEYFFFYVYNDAWNQHQGDWDGQIELFVDARSTALRYAVFRFHHNAWVTEVTSAADASLVDWLAAWTAVENDEASADVLGRCYHVQGHPFVFVAQGAHGAYPTPGFSIQGRELPGNDFLASTDERDIGGACIRARGVTEKLLRALLADAGVAGGVMRAWHDGELVESPKPTQQWLKYRGRWGQPAAYRGWDGPSQPPITRNPNTVEHAYLLPELLHFTLQHRYRGGDPLGGPIGRPIANWHGL